MNTKEMWQKIKELSGKILAQADRDKKAKKEGAQEEYDDAMVVWRNAMSYLEVEEEEKKEKEKVEV